MGKRQRLAKRKKSSESDVEGRSKKQVKRGGKSEKNRSFVSELISEANSVLCDQDNKYYQVSDSDMESESETNSDINSSVFFSRIKTKFNHGFRFIIKTKWLWETWFSVIKNGHSYNDHVGDEK